MFYIYADGESIYDPTIESLYLFEPKLKLEFGKAGSLEFTIPSNHAYFNSLKQLKTIVTVSLDDEELFRGRVLSIEQNIQNFKTIYCEGDLAFLVDSVQKGEKYKGKTHDLFRKIIANHNKRVEDYKKFTVGNITIDNRDIILVGHSEEGSEDINVGDIDYKQIAIDSIVDNWNNTYDYIQTCLIDYCGGYLRTRRVGNTTYLDYLKEYAGTETQQIAFGENILDLTKEVNAEDLFTVLIPLGDDNLTISSVNGGSDELVDKKAVQQYGRIIRTNVFSNVNEASTLLENAKRYLASNVNVPTTITVNAIDMHLVDSSITAIHVGNRVHVNASPHSLVEDLTCTAIEYDLANPENNTYTFGNPKQSLTERYKEDKRKSNDTYGNGDGASATGYSVGGAGAAVAKKSAEETVKKVNNEFEEWLDIDPNNPDGIGSLGALYRYTKDHFDVVQSVGINFDATEGNINIQSLAERTDKLSGETVAARAAAESIATMVDGRLQATERLVAQIGDKEASFEVTAMEALDGKIQTAIKGKADVLDLQAVQASIKGYDEEQLSMKRLLKKWVGLDFDAKTGTVNLGSLAEVVNSQGQTIQTNTAQLTMVANQQKAQATQIAQVEKNGKKIEASITTTASSLGSRIDLKADKTTVDGDLNVINGRLTAIDAEITNLKARKITADEIESAIGIIERLAVKNLSASSLTSPSISISGGDGGTFPVASQAFVTSSINSIANGNELGLHYHEVTENVSAGTITLGKPTSTPQSFNIRATKTYKEGVAAAASAAEITNFRLTKSGDDTYFPTSHNIQTHIVASYKLGDKDVTRPAVAFTVSGSDAYNAGLLKGQSGQEAAIEAAVGNVTIRSVGRDTSRAIEHTVSGTTHYISVPVRAVASNGNNSDDLPVGNRTISVSAQNEYNEGRQSVKIQKTNITKTAEKYNPSTYNTTLTIKATADNNESNTQTFTTSTTAYDTGLQKGLKDGKDAVTLKAADIVVKTANNIADKKMTIDVSAKLSNDKTTTKPTITVNALPFYNKGKDDYTVSTANLSWSARKENNVNQLYDPDSKNITKYITLSAKYAIGTTVTRNSSIVVSGADAYKAGETNGKKLGSEAVTVKTITNSLEDSTTYNKSITIGNSYTSYNNNIIYGRATINLSSDKNPCIVRIGMNGTKAYNAGKDAGKAIDTLGYNPNGSAVHHGSYGTETKDSAGTLTARYVRFPIIATSKGGGSKTANLYISTDKEYSDGYNYAKVVTDISINGKVTREDYATATKDSTGTPCYRHLRIPIIATSKGGGSKTATLIIETDTDYSAGWTAAPSGGDVSDVSVTVTSVKYNYYTDRYEVYGTVSLDGESENWSDEYY